MSKNNQYDNKGFTLLELIIIISIMGILGTIVSPSIIGYVEMSNKRVCNLNCLELEKTYNAYLEMENIQHSETIFTKFLEDNDEICPTYGEISYREGSITCNIHSNEDDSENDDEDVPYL